ncbi:hypothetical protein N9I71_00810 [Amylibacter sp.]|nr:hypothetical protein [Amylibacter sp.]MDB4080896.1 hypothetical protein [Amylibacter sp.]
MKTQQRYTAEKFKWNFTKISLIMVAISPAFLLGAGNRPLGLIFFMGISPFFALKKNYDFTTFVLLAFCGSIVFSVGVINFETVRWSTVLYTLMFSSFYIAYVNSLKSGSMQISEFIKICKFILLAYFFTLLIQQFCVLFGLPIFNVSNYNPSSPWKLNSLAAEPSHSARIIALVMLAYVMAIKIIKDSQTLKPSQREQMLVWFAFFYSMMTLGSATGVFMLFIIILYKFGKFNMKSFILAFATILIVLSFFPIEQLNRVINLTISIFTLDYNQMLSADHSGAMRIAPLFVLFNEVKIFSVNGIFGHGVDSVGLFMSNYISGIEEGTSGGGLMVLWYEYGVLSFALFSYFSIRTMYIKKEPIFVLIWLIMVFIAGVNNQILWLSIIIYTTLQFFNSQMCNLNLYSSKNAD